VNAPDYAKRTVDLPVAAVRPQRRISLAWIVTALVVLLAGWLAYRAWLGRGYIITIRFDDGHGIKTGDDLRYRGISVGEVRSVTLDPELDRVVATVSLRHDAADLARLGSRFWVVRPDISLRGVAGLETLVGARYLAVLPGSGPRQRRFDALPEAPIVSSIEPGALEIILEASRRGSLRRGAPVTYRQVRIGTVISVGLASDAGTIEARAHIEAPYATLVRERSRFWDAGGVEVELGLSGLRLAVDSAEALLAGGVAVATPPEGGSVVTTGRRFPLALKPDRDWLEWEPLIAVGSSYLPAGLAPPHPMRATIGWTEGRWLRGERSRHGWVLRVDTGLLGPADLFMPDDEANSGTAYLAVSGRQVDLATRPTWTGNGLAVFPAKVGAVPWLSRRVRTPDAPEDCLVIADPALAPVPLAAGRLEVDDGAWAVDPAITFEPWWHGSCVVSRDDATLIGLLLIDEDDGARVALIPDGVPLED
jgi:hypothetical protein